MKELDTFITNTGSLDERIMRSTGLSGVDELLEVMATRGKNRATDLLIESPCNRNCVTCFFQETGGPGQIKLRPEIISDIRQTVDTLGTSDSRLFTLYPKEITTAMNLLPIFSERQITRTLANGKLLGKPEILQALKNAGIVTLMVTVPGDVEAYSIYTQEKPCTYKALLNNIQSAVRAGFTVNAFYPVFQPNVDDVLPVTKRLFEIGVKAIKFLRVIPTGAASNLPSELFLTKNDTMRFLQNVNRVRKETEGKIGLSLFGGSFGPNFFGFSIYRYLAGLTDKWPDSKYLCPMIGGQFIGVSYGSGKVYPCFKALSFPELQIGVYKNGQLTFENPVVTADELQRNLQEQCSEDSCEYQPLCLGGCRIAAFSFAKLQNVENPLFAGQDICVTRILEEQQ